MSRVVVASVLPNKHPSSSSLFLLWGSKSVKVAMGLGFCKRERERGSGEAEAELERHAPSALVKGGRGNRDGYILGTRATTAPLIY
jgi:hypothetical protein